MSHYRQQFPTAVAEKEADTPCPADPQNQKHLWDKQPQTEMRKSPEGYEWEAHPWVCRNCDKTVWIPKGIELK